MKLSKAQQSVLNEMRSEGLLLWTNEGQNYKAWIGDDDGNKVKSVNRRTAEALFSGGLIVPTNHSNESLFSYGLPKSM